MADQDNVAVAQSHTRNAAAKMFHTEKDVGTTSQDLEEAFGLQFHRKLQEKILFEKMRLDGIFMNLHLRTCRFQHAFQRKVTVAVQ